METVVLKIGGSLKGQHLHGVAQVNRVLRRMGKALVVVHGGGPRISSALSARGLTMPWHEGQRVTSTEAVQVVREVLCGQVNGELVRDLQSSGVGAQGLFGVKGMILAKPLPSLERTGDVAKVRAGEIFKVLKCGGVPVIAPVGVDESGEACNINADLAAASVAGAVNAERILFLTDVDGIYYDFSNKRRLGDTTAENLFRWMERGAFTAGMIPKVRAVLRALNQGVQSAYVVEGSRPQSVVAAATKLTEDAWTEGAGTRVTQ